MKHNPWMLLVWAAIVLFPGLLFAQSGGRRVVPGTTGANAACALCETAGGWTEVPLTAARTDSIGRDIALYNLKLVARTDSLYRIGRFGPPGEEGTMRGARTHFMLRSKSGFRYTADLALKDREVTLVQSEEELAPFSRSYANAAVYPLRFVRRARIGMGAFCVDYDIPAVYDERVRDGGVVVRVRREDATLQNGDRVPVMNREFPTSQHKTVEMLFESRFCGRVREEIVVDRGDTLRVLSLDGMNGSYARKWGVHKLEAIVEWRSVVHGDADPALPRLGACAYFPEIHLEMPLFLPDLGLSDLREFDFPVPMMYGAWYQTPPADLPVWLNVERTATIHGWRSIGPRPEVVEARYPDL